MILTGTPELLNGQAADAQRYDAVDLSECPSTNLLQDVCYRCK